MLCSSVRLVFSYNKLSAHNVPTLNQEMVLFCSFYPQTPCPIKIYFYFTLSLHYTLTMNQDQTSSILSLNFYISFSPSFLHHFSHVIYCLNFFSLPLKFPLKPENIYCH